MFNDVPDWHILKKYIYIKFKKKKHPYSDLGSLWKKRNESQLNLREQKDSRTSVCSDSAKWTIWEIAAVSVNAGMSLA